MHNKKLLVSYFSSLMFIFFATINGFANEVDSSDRQHVHQHAHQQVEVPDNALQPQIEIQLYADKQSGYNLHIQLVNYKIQPPELADDAKKSDEKVVNGHAHLFINGTKIGRIYAPHHHLPGNLLKQGINTITVTLNTHQHDTLTINGKPITATVALDTTKENSVINRFSSSPITQ